MDEFAIKSIDEIITDVFKSLVNALQDICEQWLPNVKPKNIKRGKAPLRAKIAKYQKAPRKFMTQKITVLFLDKRTKIHRCRNHCRKYGRQHAIKHQGSTAEHSSEVGSFYFGKRRIAVFI